jgi:hypothetical protein
LQLLGQPDDPLPKNGVSDQQFDVQFGQTGGSKVVQAPQRAATEVARITERLAGRVKGLSADFYVLLSTCRGAATPGGGFHDVKRLRHNVVVAANTSIFPIKSRPARKKTATRCAPARRRQIGGANAGDLKAGRDPGSAARTAATRTAKPARCLDAMSATGGASGTTMAERCGGPVIPGRGVGKIAIGRRASRIFAEARR